MERPENGVAKLWPFSTKRTEKGPKSPNFWKVCFLPLILSYSRHESPKKYYTFPTEILKTKDSFVYKRTKTSKTFKIVKITNYQSAEYFSSAVEFFCWTGRKFCQNLAITGEYGIRLPATTTVKIVRGEMLLFTVLLLVCDRQ